MPLVIELEHEFIARHGGDTFAGQRVSIGPGQWCFADGAMLTQHGTNAPMHVEPPENLRQRLELRRRYHNARKVTFEQAFAALKNALLGNGVSFSWHPDYGPDPGGGKPALLQLRALAADQRKRVAALDAEIFNLPENVARRAYDAEQREWREQEEAKRQAFISEIMGINLEPAETFQPETIRPLQGDLT
jgi:hypothetical protein